MSFLIAHGIIDATLAIIIAIVGWVLWGFGRTVDHFAAQQKEEREARQDHEDRMLEAISKMGESLTKLSVEVGKDYVTRREMGIQLAQIKTDFQERIRSLETLVHDRRGHSI